MTRLLPTALLLGGFALAVGVRVTVGGAAVAQSQPAALLFAGVLLLLVLAAGTRVTASRQALLVGLAGVVVVCAPVAVSAAFALRPLRDGAGFWPWAAVVVVVATAEELFLRGALYDAVAGLAGAAPAVAVGAVAFALLHVPLYGWHVVPLDLAVGVVLGGLREGTGTPLAPAVTHVGADLVGWFLR